MRARLIVVTSLLGAASPPAQASVVERIRDAVDQARVVRSGAVARLYGVSIDGADTAHGRLACARVVAIILNKAGVRISNGLVSVRSVEKTLGALQSWRTVVREDRVRPGDIVIYRAGWNGSGECTGGGTCHVVIAASDGRVFGNIPYDVPPFFKKGPTTHWKFWSRLAGFRFKIAYRPPG